MKSNLNQYNEYYKSMGKLFKSKKAQAYTMIILSLFTMSFFGFFAIRPTLKTIAVLRKKIEDHTLVNTKLEDKINALIQAQEEFQKIEPDLAAIYSLLPDKIEFSSLLINLENLAVQTDTQVSTVTFDNFTLYGLSAEDQAAAEIEAETDVLSGHTTAQTTPFTFRVSYNGSYDNLIALLKRLTNLERLVTITSIDMVANDRDSENSTLIINLEQEGYYFPLNL